METIINLLFCLAIGICGLLVSALLTKITCKTVKH